MSPIYLPVVSLRSRSPQRTRADAVAHLLYAVAREAALLGRELALRVNSPIASGDN
jgi:hypothetical protein